MLLDEEPCLTVLVQERCRQSRPVEKVAAQILRQNAGAGLRLDEGAHHTDVAGHAARQRLQPPRRKSSGFGRQIEIGRIGAHEIGGVCLTRVRRLKQVKPDIRQLSYREFTALWLVQPDGEIGLPPGQADVLVRRCELERYPRISRQEVHSPWRENLL